MNVRDTTNKTNDGLKRGQDLLAKAKKANSDFVQKTDILIKNINQGINQANQELGKNQKEFKNFEKDSTNKMDKAVLEFLSEE